MDSASFQFVLYGIAVAVVSNLSRSRTWRCCTLMLASLVFLALLIHEPLLFLPFTGFLLLGYAALALLRRGWSGGLASSLVLVIFAYVWLKRYTFLPEGMLLHSPYFTLGLSYVFFRVLHVLLEARDNEVIGKMGIGSYLLYLLNFTTFVSGPIQRYEEFARDQFADEPIALGPRTVGIQLERIIRGLFKVNVLAMVMNAWRLDAFAELAQPLPLSVKMCSACRLVVLYPLFLYCNFSGYIDIVIALARLMRLRLPENFNRPFSASSFLDFWNRWHITLSTWLKTYIYNPLLLALMRRVSSLRAQAYLGVLCFFVTFFLVGIWHGRTSEFAFFGVLQGGGVAINKLWQIWMAKVMGRSGYKALAANVVYVSFGRGLTFTWFALTLVWFWADWRGIRQIFATFNALQWAGILLTIWLASTAVLALWEWLREKLLGIRTAQGPLLTSRYALVVFASILCLVELFVTLLLNQSAPGLVYKTF